VQPKTRPLGIIGAGIAGLAAAYVAARADVRTTLLERSDVVGGRAETIRRDTFVVDPAAQYLQPEAKGARQIFKTLPNGDLTRINEPIAVLTGGGQIIPGDPTENERPKYSYKNGIITICRLLLEGSRTDLRLNCEISRISREDQGWRIYTDDGSDLGHYRALILAIPPRRARDLLDPSGHSELKGILDTGSFRPIVAYVFAFDRRLSAGFDWYALLNVDKRHDITWLAFEEHKPGHVPDEMSGVVIHMSSEWTVRNRTNPTRARIALDQCRGVLDVALPEPLWCEERYWELGLPTLPIGDVQSPEDGLFLCGDGYSGGGLDLAMESGINAGRMAIV
jgi:renalase